CELVIFLDMDREDKHCATFLDLSSPAEGKPIAAVRQEKLDELDHQADVLERNQKIARLKAELKAVQPQKKDSTDILEQKLQERRRLHKVLHSCVHEMATEDGKDAEIRYANDQ